VQVNQFIWRLDYAGEYIGVSLHMTPVALLQCMCYHGCIMLTARSATLQALQFSLWLHSFRRCIMGFCATALPKYST
jgi:hypothetical protein